MVATEHNIRDVGTLPLSKELEARSGKKEPVLTIYQFCNSTIARRMADFSPAMSAYMPCRVSLVERPDGLYLYTLNMDMMVKMWRKLPSPLNEEAWRNFGGNGCAGTQRRRCAVRRRSIKGSAAPSSSR